eukprot:TRINITY_DN1026_c0_g2_i1.p1 TRINITY_DN1026_c0_g2~~TRINITY_DN1026_c0_g2_i1.p1  ORF type:complete len:600 (+),score=84.80 TRINITY_DN1026_c0_g2_i1:105-1904(+)
MELPAFIPRASRIQRLASSNGTRPLLVGSDAANAVPKPPRKSKTRAVVSQDVGFRQEIRRPTSIKFRIARPATVEDKVYKSDSAEYLPIEIWELIMCKCLTAKCIAQMARTHRAWAALARQNSVWKALSLRRWSAYACDVDRYGGDWKSLYRDGATLGLRSFMFCDAVHTLRVAHDPADVDMCLVEMLLSMIRNPGTVAVGAVQPAIGENLARSTTLIPDLVAACSRPTRRIALTVLQAICEREALRSVAIERGVLEALMNALCTTHLLILYDHGVELWQITLKTILLLLSSHPAARDRLLDAGLCDVVTRLVQAVGTFISAALLDPLSDVLYAVFLYRPYPVIAAQKDIVLPVTLLLQLARWQSFWKLTWVLSSTINSVSSIPAPLVTESEMYEHFIGLRDRHQRLPGEIWSLLEHLRLYGTDQELLSICSAKFAKTLMHFVFKDPQTAASSYRSIGLRVLARCANAGAVMMQRLVKLDLVPHTVGLLYEQPETVNKDAVTILVNLANSCAPDVIGFLVHSGCIDGLVRALRYRSVAGLLLKALHYLLKLQFAVQEFSVNHVTVAMVACEAPRALRDLCCDCADEQVVNSVLEMLQYF